MSTTCKRCALPTAISSRPSTLYLQVPAGYLQDKLLSIYEKASLHCEVHVAGTLASHLCAGELDPLLDRFESDLTVMEQQAVHCAISPQSDLKMVPDTVMNSSLSVLLGQRRNAWLTDLIRERRLFTAFQPIVRTRGGFCESIYGYECLLRARNSAGDLLPPAQLFQSARSSDLLYQLDMAARSSAVRAAADAGIEQCIFINFNPTAIYDPAHCLESTLELIDQRGIEHHRIIFEIVESEHVPEISHMHAILDYYRSQGFRVAMDDLGSGFSSMRLLSELRPDFVKLDMNLIRDVHRDAWKAVITSHMIEVAHDLGLPVIAEGIETLDEARWLEAHRVEYQQGYFHGYPELTPASQQIMRTA